MKKLILPTILLFAIATLSGLPTLAQPGFESGVSARNDPCWFGADATVMDNSNQRQQWTISFELLESILGRGDGYANSALTRIMTGPPQGELMAIFAVTEPDGLGGRKITNPTGQAEFDHLKSVDGLMVSEYGLISVPWTVILEDGLPQLPAGSTSATFVCRPSSDARS